MTKGFKIADIDPRAEEYDNCFTISDKARCIAGGVLEALLYLKNNLSDQQEEPNVPICIHEKQKVETIYADYAATHITKPECVKDAVMNALALGNSGRGVNESSLDAARKIYEVRTKVDQFFDGYGAEQVVFTSGITESLNTVIKGSLNHGDHVITTFMEHNSVLRPLYEMERQGVCLTITSPDVGDIKQAITKDTKMIVMTHASNVTGEMFDIQSVGKLCREKGILFVVDTAQSAGVTPISMKEDNIDILCFTGHKGLMGPQGIGGICIRKGVEIRPLKTGGTGILSFSKTQPGVLPQALEAGTECCIYDKYNKIYLLNGNKTIKKADQYGKYISFVPMTEEVVLTLKGLKYPLNGYILRQGLSICQSNEIKEETAEILIEKGIVAAIESRD